MDDSTISHLPLFMGLPNKYLDSHVKTVRAWKYVYRNLPEKYDWYFKSDTDTYLIVEHLRDYLKTLNPDEPHYLGSWYKTHVTHGYNAGGGYVLSHEALKRMVEGLEKDPSLDVKDEYEDIGIARILEKLNIYPESTFDENGKVRFLHSSFKEHMHEFHKLFYAEPIKSGIKALSPKLIMIHHVNPIEMRLLEFILYGVDRK